MKRAKSIYLVLAIIGIILLPICLNYILQIRTNLSVVGDPVTWLAFWGSFIGAIASFAMVFITYYTLKQNKTQLEELKRQWEEEHRPHLSCRVIVYKKAFFLQIYNPSQYDAHEVKITFGEDLINHLNATYRPLYENTSQNPVFIPSGKAWNNLLGWCSDINAEWKEDEFEIVVEGYYNQKYSFKTIIPTKTFVDRHNIVVISTLEDAVKDLASGLVEPHSSSPHKAVQVSMEEISKTLNQILSRLSKK